MPLQAFVNANAGLKKLFSITIYGMVTPLLVVALDAKKRQPGISFTEQREELDEQPHTESGKE